MNQAVDGFSSLGPVPSTGQNDEKSPRSPTQKRGGTRGTGRLFHDEGYNSDALYAMAGSDSDRLHCIGDRAVDLERLVDTLSCSDELNRHSRSILAIIARELDMIATIAISPMVRAEPIA